MNTIIGMCVVLITIISGYLMEHGNLSVLFQPAEFVIIYGAAVGGFIIASPGKIISLTIREIKRLFSGKGVTREDYLDLLLLLHELFTKCRREGILSLEGDIEKPEKSEIFKRHKKIVEDEEVIDFIRDNFRVIILGVQHFEVVELLEIDIESGKREALIPSQGIAKVADALPGLGIVAAVLGVVLTMGKISEPPEVLGHSIGAALVGTFLGVLACYGFVGPMATNLEHKAKEKEPYFNVIKTALQHFESTPALTIETARREIPTSERPSYKEFEELKKKWNPK